MRWITSFRVSLLIAFAWACCGPHTALFAGDFLIKDNDTVAFLGDSITAARGYPKIVEHYTLMRYPDRKIRFYNAGKGGDTAQSSIARLDRDVFSRRATVMLVALGVNDIGWGTKADAAHKKLYLDGIRTLIAKCNEKQVRVIVCSPAITAENPDAAEKGFLQHMADEGMELGKTLGAGAIDVSRGMRAIQRPMWKFNAAEPDAAKHVSLHAADGVHLNDLGQLAMAFVILKGLGAPALVSSMTVDAKDGKVVASDGCRVSGVHVRQDGITFTRHDDGLPINRGILSSFDYRWIPVPDQLNRYELRITNLPEGKYAVRAEKRSLGTLTSEQLSKGVSVASMTPDAWEPGGPWDVQSSVVKELVEARDRLLHGSFLRSIYDPDKPATADMRGLYDDLDGGLVDLARKSAHPLPYRFEVRRVEEK